MSGMQPIFLGEGRFWEEIDAIETEKYLCSMSFSLVCTSSTSEKASRGDFTVRVL